MCITSDGVDFLAFKDVLAYVLIHLHCPNPSRLTGPLTGGLTCQFLRGPKKIGGPEWVTGNFEGAQRSAECKNRKKKNKKKERKKEIKESRQNN